MKNFRHWVLFMAIAGAAPHVGLTADRVAVANNAEVESAVLAADVEREAAFRSADAARLGAILSDELRYAHSNGAVDTKASLIANLVSGKAVYEKFDYRERTIRAAAPGVALMSGRVLVSVAGAGGKQTLDLNYLAVWRQEGGRWRFLAWQSSRNPAPPAGGK